jgi:hypothetical protein
MHEESAMLFDLGHEKAAGALKGKDEGLILFSEAPGENISLGQGLAQSAFIPQAALKEDHHALPAP